MMSAIYGRMSGQPFATFDRDSHSWRTSAAISLWDLPMCLETVPPMGYLHDGSLFELQMPERHIIERVYSSLLATPTAWLGSRPAHSEGNPDRWRNPDRSNELSDQIATLLPTPTSQAAKHGETPDLTANSFGSNLWDLPHLLPTPAVNDMGAGKDPEAWQAWIQKMRQAHGNGNGHGKSLEQEALKMLPTPKASDGERGRDASRERPDLRSRELATVLGHSSISESMSQRSADGNQSSEDLLQIPLFEEKIEGG